jgi:hypothetical protein
MGVEGKGLGTLQPFAGGVGLNRANPAVENDVVGEASLAPDLFGADAVRDRQTFFQLKILAPVGDADRTDPAVETAGAASFCFRISMVPPFISGSQR